MEAPAGAPSGSQQQMVAIRRALMAQPRLLLLVEQNVAMAPEITQRAYMLEEGRILARGSPADLLAQPHIRRDGVTIADCVERDGDHRHFIWRVADRLFSIARRPRGP